jgi:hypothetical protein
MWCAQKAFMASLRKTGTGAAVSIAKSKQVHLPMILFGSGRTIGQSLFFKPHVRGQAAALVEQATVRGCLCVCVCVCFI